jgi:hypothetical protein
MAQYVPPPFPHNEVGREFSRRTTKEKLDRAHDRHAEGTRAMDQIRNMPGSPQIQADSWSSQKPPKRSWWRRLFDRLRRKPANG